MSIKRFYICVGLLLYTEAFSANYDFSYSGRLVDNTGKPYDGPVALKASFFHTDVGSTPILEVTTGLTQVPLSEGVFQIKLSLSESDFQMVFPSVSQSVYIQITNLTHTPTQPYDRQQLTILPYAGKIPVDPTQFNWDSNGQLRFTASSSADFTSAGPIGTTVPNTAVFTTVSTNRTSTATSGSVVNVTIAPTYNQTASSAANTDLLINRTQTSVGSGAQRLIDAQVGGTTRFNVSNSGDGYFAGNVGIGTTSPSGRLQVTSSNASNLVVYDDGSALVGSYPSSLTNLAPNPDFSSGITGWTSMQINDGSTQSWQNVASGDGSLGFLRFNIGAGPNYDRFGTSSGIVAAGTTYNVSFWYRTTGITGPVVFFSTSNFTTLANLTSFNIPLSSSWTYTSFSFTPVSSSAPFVGFHKFGNIGSGTFDIDRISISVAGGTVAPTLTLSSNGSVGVGHSSGANRLDVAGSAAFGTYAGTAAPANGLLVSGNVGIGNPSPSQRLSVGANGDGSVAIANSWTTYSDKRLKQNVSIIDNALDKISKLAGYFFYWKKGDDSSRQVGVMAQDVEEIFPEVVKTGSDGVKSVDYPKLVAPMIEAIKELKSFVEKMLGSQSLEIAKLRSEKDIEINQLKGENEAMRIVLCEIRPNASFCAKD